MSRSNVISVQDRREKIEKAKALLAAGVEQLQGSDGWKTMLDALARGGRLSIRRFSFRNQMLIWMQRPTASAVATYRSWLRQGRQVRRGERSVLVLAPVIVSKPKTGKPDETESRLVGFRTLPVFDVSQTDPVPGSKSLPEPASITTDITTPELFDRSVEVLRSVVLSLGPEVVSGVELRPRREDDHPEAHGWYERGSKKITIITGERSASHEFKTLLHEVGHALLHGSDDHHARAEMEVEAESVAYVVGKVLGLDTSGFSFGYVCSWAGTEKAQTMVLKSGERIVKAVNTILDALLGPVDGDEQDQEAA